MVCLKVIQTNLTNLVTKIQQSEVDLILNFWQPLISQFEVSANPALMDIL